MSVPLSQSAFVQKCAEAMYSTLSAISAGLKSKHGLGIGADELAALASLPVSAQPMSAPAISAPASRASKAAPGGRTCTYTFSRGERSGQACGKPALPDRDRCNQCKDKGKNKPTGGKASAGKAKAESAPPAANFSSAGTDAGAPNIGADQWKVDKSYAKVNGPTPYLVKEEKDGSIVVYGKEKDDKLVPITSAEKDAAVALGMIVKEGAVGAQVEGSHAPPSLYASNGGPPMPVVTGAPPVYMAPSYVAPSANGTRIQ